MKIIDLEKYFKEVPLHLIEYSELDIVIENIELLKKYKAVDNYSNLTEKRDILIKINTIEQRLYKIYLKVARREHNFKYRMLRKENTPEKFIKQEIIKNSDNTINSAITIYQKGIRTFDIVTEYFKNNELDEFQTDRYYGYNTTMDEFNVTVEYLQKNTK